MSFSDNTLRAIYDYDHVDDSHLSSEPCPNASFNIWFHNNEQYLDSVQDWFDLNSDRYATAPMDELIMIICARLRFTRKHWTTGPIGCFH